MPLAGAISGLNGTWRLLIAGKRRINTIVVAMAGRYDQSDLNVYGAEDDDEMDSILDALERANQERESRPALPNPKLDRRR